MRAMQRIWLSFLYAWRGLRAVFREELNFRIELLGACAALGVALWFHFSSMEFFFVLVAIALVLGGEVVNTVIEDLCNKIQPNQDPVIGKIKDMAAGFMLIQVAIALLIGVMIIVTHVYQ